MRLKWLTPIRWYAVVLNTGIRLELTLLGLTAIMVEVLGFGFKLEIYHDKRRGRR